MLSPDELQKNLTRWCHVAPTTGGISTRQSHPSRNILLYLISEVWLRPIRQTSHTYVIQTLAFHTPSFARVQSQTSLTINLFINNYLTR